MIFSVFREAVKRDVDTTQLFRVQPRPQGGSDLCLQDGKDGFPVGWPELGEDNAEKRVVLVPAGDVCLTGDREEGGDRLTEYGAAGGLQGHLTRIEQHQYEEPSRAFRPFALQAERVKERRLG